ncbi:MAG: SH3 domain-containing protein [Candidatus Promineifilaceae bacterium]|nr:SH3 domain-containing protein [Candidatus Promineifilaceae bacterium]
MGDLLIPVLLAIAGLIAALATYRGIRRGGARYYTLEREAMLRRASLTLFLSVLLFIGAIGYLAYQQRQALPDTSEESVTEEESVAESTITPTQFVEQFPPTATAGSESPEATPTATPLVCRAIVDGTSGNGLTLRVNPGGEEITVLPDGSVLTVLEDEPTESGGFVWRKVRVVGGEEGWVAEDFLTIRAPCN